MTTEVAALLALVVTSITSIILAIINGRKLAVIHEQTNSMNAALTTRNQAQQTQAVADAGQIGRQAEQAATDATEIQRLKSNQRGQQ